MNKNIGNTDRIIRILLALIIFGLGFVYSSWYALIGFIPLFTAAVSWCPLYCPLKINTCKDNCKN